MPQDGFPSYIDTQGHQNQKGGGIHQGVDLNAISLGKLVGEQCGEGVRRCQERPGKPLTVSNKHGYGHCLAHL